LEVDHFTAAVPVQTQALDALCQHICGMDPIPNRLADNALNPLVEVGAIKLADDGQSLVHVGIELQSDILSRQAQGDVLNLLARCVACIASEAAIVARLS